MQLPDIGEITARSIVEERNAHGPYTDVDDLRRRVHGIGPRLVEKIAPYLGPLNAEDDANRPRADGPAFSTSR